MDSTNNSQNVISIPPFVLYGLIGCPHCAEAESYLKRAGVSFWVFVANEDPIADEGVKKVSGREQSTYPVLLYKLTKEIVVEYKPEEYERLVKDFYTRVSASTPSVFGGQQPDIAQGSQQASAA